MLIRRRSVHGAWVERPIDLAAIREERKIDDASLAGVVRAGVGRRIETIRRARLGSLTKPSARVKAEVLGSRRLRTELSAIAENEDIPTAEIEPRAKDIIKKLATDFRPSVLSLFATVMAFVWKRIYTGIDVDNKDLDNLREAVGRGPLLLLPTHKSHIDYIVISQVMRDANIMMPHIAAGENLSFWPLGWLFRSSGAFFIRRKFINDRFYTAVVNGYIRRLIQSGLAIEVFIEGGRSRTGKLLRPKLGMLEMALRALATTPRQKLQVMPIFIGYEQVIEEGAYVRESEGKPKKKENVARLIKSIGVLFNRYGKLHVRTGEVFDIADMIESGGWSREDLEDSHSRREVALQIALRTLREINRVSVATPSAVLATVLLTAPEPRIERQSLRDQTLWLTELLEAIGATLSDPVERWSSQGGGETLDQAIEAFTEGNRIEVTEDDEAYEVPAAQRLPLDYYKNNVIHFFVPAALVAASCSAVAEGRVALADVREDLALACRLYHWEFLLPAYSQEREAEFTGHVEDMLDRGVKALAKLGTIAVDGEQATVLEPERLRFVADVLRNFHEVYHAALLAVRERALGEFDGDPVRLARERFETAIADGKYVKPEGASRLILRSAFQAFKELRISRPATGERPFDEDGLGGRLIGLLERFLA